MDIAIIREKNIPLHRDRMSVVFPDTFLFSDDYAEKIVENEILDRYGDWLDEQRRLLDRDEDLAML